MRASFIGRNRRKEATTNSLKGFELMDLYPGSCTFHHIARHGYIHLSNPHQDPQYALYTLLRQTNPDVPHCAATLILSCLCLCCACKFSLSTAYSNPSFFLLNCFSLKASLLPPRLALFTSPAPLPPPLLESPALPIDARPSPIRPSRSSERAIRALSRRESLSRCVSTRVRRVWISGVREARRVD